MHQNVDWLKSFYPPGFSLVFARTWNPAKFRHVWGVLPKRTGS
ncbi:hypothetical protein ACIPMU_02245 [Streptomyces cyaneofuscatus]